MRCIARADDEGVFAPVSGMVFFVDGFAEAQELGSGDEMGASVPVGFLA